MAYITADMLKTFSDKFPNDDTLLAGYCEAAEQIVARYLGYSPELREYDTTELGIGAKCLALEAMPIVEVFSVAADGAEIEVEKIRVVKNRNYIAFTNNARFFDGVTYRVTYAAGYETVPAQIVTAALQIASLLWESAGGNLAVTSTSFADIGSRTFQSFKPDRFLDQIASYKKVDTSY